MKTILTYGTFDLFHVGHVRLLKRLKALGDRLIVGVSTDEFNESKGKKSFYSYLERSEIVEACQYVSEVFPEHSWDQKEHDVEHYAVNVFAMGDDWSGKFDFLNSRCKVVYLKRTEEVSSTDIRKTLTRLNVSELERIEDSLHSVIDIVKNLSRQT